jgi:DNA recombination protein RmuC
VSDIFVWGGLVLGVLNLLLLVLVLARARSPAADADLMAEKQQEHQAQLARHQAVVAQIGTSADKLNRDLQRNITESSRDARQELAQTLATFQQTLVQQSFEATRTQNTQIDAFGQQLALLQKTLADTLSTQLSGLSESNVRRMREIRETLDAQLAQLQSSNAAKLDEMRATVDEKLQATLQTRLGESFRQVAERLEQVHKGLGEMQTLAQGVGDLKHLLTNVKTRGIFGEAQLASLLEQVMVPDQYAAQVATRPGSKNVVDFAIRLPGRTRHW